jgi:uncharacterized caspase-like protein
MKGLLAWRRPKSVTEVTIPDVLLYLLYRAWIGRFGKRILDMRAWTLAAAIMVACTLHGNPSLAAKREALVIGNGAYQSVPRLLNPSNDAQDISAALARLDFNVRTVTNASFESMRTALRDFAALARQADMAVIFYAGHGMEIRDENWLLPIDAQLKLDLSVAQEAISLSSVLATVSAARKLGLVLLDACRDNPFLARMQSTASTRSTSNRGLSAIEPPSSVLVMFAAKHGTAAADGTSRNSPFTTALLHHIEKPGLELNYLFRNVHDDVLAMTRQQQEPYVYGSLSKEPIYFRPPAHEPSSSSPPAADEAARAWASIQGSTDPGEFEAFIRHFNNSFYADLARNRLAALQQQQAAIQRQEPFRPISQQPSTARADSSPSPASQATAALSQEPKAGHASIPSQSPLVKRWFWRSSCGALGNFQGELLITHAADGQIKGVFKDKGNSREFPLFNTSLSDTTLAFHKRSAQGSTQRWTAQIIRQANGKTSLKGSLTDSVLTFGRCTWRASAD